MTPESLIARLRRIEAQLETATAGAPSASPTSAPVDLSDLLDRLEEQATTIATTVESDRAKSRQTKEQFEELVDVVTALAALDYSRRAVVYEGQDEVTNALAIGLNMMCEELEHATTELIHKRDEALAANRAKSTFLANMSHEFRTPLNAIIGYSELLVDEHSEAATPAMLNDLHRINGAARHVLDLIQDTLDISKIEAEKLELESARVNLPELLEDILATITPTIQQRNNRLVHLSEYDAIDILGDSTRIRQILLNLLSNASKFTRNGVITLSVTERRGENNAQFIDFAVTDTGIGIPTEMLDRIFNAFTQADGSTTRIYGGTGLGLTISRRLCQMMGGSLTVTSEVGRGSTFIASLPGQPPSGTASACISQSLYDRAF